MKQYQTFTIDAYDFDRAARTITLRYGLDDEVTFAETLTFPKELELPAEDPPGLQELLTALLIAGGVSYYKSCLPKKIDVRAATLSKEQADFWTTVYERGLGEFFYRNQIDHRGLIAFPSSGNTPAGHPPRQTKELKAPKILVPVGGGKDSAVTIALLQQAGVEVTLFRVGRHPLIDAFVEETGLPCLTLERAISPALLELNARGALNGHIPITAFLSILAVITAALTGHDAVAMSNESSANEGNIRHHDLEVNHQWSKSLEFETALQHYLSRWTTATVSYFSLLRPLNELQITQLFCDDGRFLTLCTSCNRNWKIAGEKPKEAWCGTCPKCAFVFALLAAFTDRPPLEAATGIKPFENTELLPLYRQLLGIEGFKPFECVGTAAETIAAFLLAHERGQFDDTPVMRMFVNDVLPGIRDHHAAVDIALSARADHAIPSQFLSLLGHAPR